MQLPPPASPAPPAPVQWFLDQTTLQQLDVLFGLVGLIFAAFALYYAWWVSRQQFDLMRRQDAREDLQFRKFQSAVAPEAKLSVIGLSDGTVENDRRNIYLVNMGDSILTDVKVQLCIDDERHSFVRIMDRKGRICELREMLFVSDGLVGPNLPYRQTTIDCPSPVPAKSDVLIARMVIAPMSPPHYPIGLSRMRYCIVTPVGRTPPVGLEIPMSGRMDAHGYDAVDEEWNSFPSWPSTP